MRKWTVLGISIVLVLSICVQANYVRNFSFEDPGDGKHTNWEAIPYWSSDVVAIDSGVESDWPGSTHGDYCGYLMSGDPSVWQLTNAVSVAEEIFTLHVDARDNWSETPPARLGMYIYYDLEGTRTHLAMQIVDLVAGPDSDWQTYTLVFAADDAPASYGNRIGVEFINFSASNSWIGIDNVRLIPEPMTMALLGFGGLFLRKRR